MENLGQTKIEKIHSFQRLDEEINSVFGAL